MARKQGRIRRVAGSALIAVVVGACGGSSSKATNSVESRAVTTLPASAATTTPDGAVPWIPTELTNADVSLTPPSIPTVDPGTPLCRGEQLQATAFSWVTKGDIEPGDNVPFDKVWGIVAVRNSSSEACRLAQQPSVTITAEPGFSVTSTPGGINDEAANRQVQMPAGEPAELRIDWEASVCDAPTTNQTVRVDLPHDAGAVSIKVAQPATPHCLQGGSASSVFAGTFTSGRHAEIPATPKLVALTAKATLPATVARGGSFGYEVALTNPTNEPIPLDPCPAYIQELFQMGSDTNAGVNTNAIYRLNCVPRPVIEAGETVRFLMNLTLPAGVGPGEFAVSWRMVSPGVGEMPVTSGSTTVA